MNKIIKYKSTGLAWCPEIPVDWEVKKLKYVVKLREENIEDSDFKIAVENIESGTGKLIGMGEEKNYQGKMSKFCENDTLFNKLRPYLHKVYFAERDGGLFGELLVIVSTGELLPKFLFYKLFDKSFVHLVNGSTEGTKMPRANWEGFIKEQLIFYPKDKILQKSIANFLDQKTADIDLIITKKQKLIECLKEERMAIINQAVTKGLDLKAKMKDSGIEWIGKIPFDWVVIKLSYDFQKIGSGTTPQAGNPMYYQDGEFNWLQTGDLNDGIITETAKKITRKSLDDYSSLKFYPIESLVIAMYGATIGKCGILGITTTTNQACCVLGKPHKFDVKFIYYWFVSNKSNIISLSYGGGQPNISQELIRNLRVQCPPLEQQKSIVKDLDQKTAEIDKIINKIEREIELINEYRTALINEVVTGKKIIE